jgi:prepilin-type processing-associated H-X9-DG protein
MYDSKAEANYASQLDLQRKAIVARYRVVDVKLQPVFVLQEKPNRITYRADFNVLYADGHREIVDVKGIQTPVFRLKLKMMKAKYPDVNVILIGKGKRN